MSYTLATATTSVRNTLNEDTAVFWSDAEIQTWIQEGCLIWSAATLLIEDSVTLTLVANQLTYSSSDDSEVGNIVEVYSAYYDDQSNNYAGLIKAHPRQLGHLDTFTAGDPKYIMLHNRLLYIWPLTNTTVRDAGGTVTVLYAKSTSDITAIQDEFQIWPIMFACARAKEKDRRESEAGPLFTQFYTMLNFERADKHAREIDSMDRFLIPNAGQGPEQSRG